MSGSLRTNDDVLTTPPDEDDSEPGECRSCGGDLCVFCWGCKAVETSACEREACTCPWGSSTRGADMPQDAYERAVDDAIDDVRAREDEGEEVPW